MAQAICAQSFGTYVNSANGAPVARVSFLHSSGWNGGNAFRDPSLVAYWNMGACYQTSFIDASGGGLTGTLGAHNGASVTIASGKTAPCAAYFNKSNYNYITFGSSPTLPTGPFTITAWVKAAGPTGSYPRIIENDYTKNLFMGGDPTDSKFSCAMPNGSTSSQTFATGGTMATGGSAWQFVACTFAGGTGGALTLYVNGSSVATATATALSATALPLEIGYCAVSSYCASSTGAWDGSIASIRIYNRALSGGEIAAIYTAENH